MNEFRFAVPKDRVAGFRAVIKESNQVAREAGLLVIRLHPVSETASHQSFKVPCSDRARMLTQELLGFLRDIEDQRPFQRTRDSKRYW